MENKSLEINCAEFNDNKTSFLLTEFLRGREEINPKDTYHLEEVKKENYGVLSFADEKFEVESLCKPRSQMEKHAICFIENGELKLIDIPYYFQISKRIKAETQKMSRRGSMNYAEKKELVVQEIGTNKSKKILKNYKTKEIDEKKISSINEISELMDSMADNYKEQTKAQKQTEIDQKLTNLKELVPEFNQKATSVQLIYPLESLIKKSDFKLIKKDFCDQKIKNKQFSKAFLQVYEKCQLDFEELDEQKKQCWIFLDFMLALFPVKKISKGLNDLAKEKKIPIQILSRLTDQFYSKSASADFGEEFIKTQKLSIKFTAHITILFLILNDFKFEISLLFPVFGISEQEFVNQLY